MFDNNILTNNILFLQMIYYSYIYHYTPTYNILLLQIIYIILTDIILLLQIIYIILTDIILLLQIIYGGHISNSYDQQTLNAVVDYWASPLAVKKDFELSRGELMLCSYWFNVSSKNFCCHS